MQFCDDFKIFFFCKLGYFISVFLTFTEKICKYIRFIEKILVWNFFEPFIGIKKNYRVSDDDGIFYAALGTAIPTWDYHLTNYDEEGNARVIPSA